MKAKNLTKFLFLLMGTAMVLSACNGQASSGKPLQGTVWVANEYGNNITVIDVATNQVLTTLTGVEGPHNLQVAPDGKTVWAVSGHESLALMIDAETYQLHGTVPTGREPAHVILAPDGKTVYVTNGDEN